MKLSQLRHWAEDQVIHNWRLRNRLPRLTRKALADASSIPTCEKSHTWVMQDVSKTERRLQCVMCGMVRMAGKNVGIEKLNI